MVTSTAAAELTRARQLLGEEVKEDEFQREVIRMAQLLHWRHYHTLSSRGSAAGFPDLALVRGDRLIFAELKRAKGRVTEDQQAWLDALGQVKTVTAHLWRPTDFDDVEEALR